MATPVSQYGYIPVITAGQANALTVVDKGAVTQTPLITDPVTLNASSGIITCVAGTAATGVSVDFTLTNDKILAGSIIMCTGEYAGAGGISVNVHTIAAGSCVVNVTNSSAVALDALYKVQFVIL